MMALVTKENSGNVFVNLKSDQLGGLVLKGKKKASGGSAAVGKRCNGRSSHWFWEISYLSKLLIGEKFSEQRDFIFHILVTK